jgi:DNA replication protein
MERNGFLQNTLVRLLEKGSISLPVVLFTEYKRIGLSEQEVMLLIHILLFQEKEQKPFPSVGELAERMNLNAGQILNMIEQLVRGGFLGIEQVVNENGVRSECYSLGPLLTQLAASFVDREEKERTERQVEDEEYSRLFHLFEREFGRTLSPMECQMLAQWLDEDGHSAELVEAALREAVFCGKTSFRYIDRILLEWQRQRIRTADEAAEYSKRFRQKGLLYQGMVKERTASGGFSFYNWVNQE